MAMVTHPQSETSGVDRGLNNPLWTFVSLFSHFLIHSHPQGKGLGLFHLCLCVCLCACVHACWCARLHPCVRASEQACIPVGQCACVSPACVQACVHASMRVRGHVGICVFHVCILAGMSKFEAKWHLQIRYMPTPSYLYEPKPACRVSTVTKTAALNS